MAKAWDQARAAQHRPLRKPIKMHGPVGPTVEPFLDYAFSIDAACEGCGHHCCSCKAEPFKVQWSEGSPLADPAYVFELGEGECCMGCVRGETCFKQLMAGLSGLNCVTRGCKPELGAWHHMSGCPKYVPMDERIVPPNIVPFAEKCRGCAGVLPEHIGPCALDPNRMTPEQVGELAARIYNNGLGEGAQLFNVPPEFRDRVELRPEEEAALAASKVTREYFGKREQVLNAGGYCSCLKCRM